MVLQRRVEVKWCGNYQMAQGSLLNSIHIIRTHRNGIVDRVTMSILQTAHLINDFYPETQYLVREVYRE